MPVMTSTHCGLAVTPKLNDESYLADDDPPDADTNGLMFVCGPLGSSEGRHMPAAHRAKAARLSRLDTIFIRKALLSQFS